MAEKFSILYVLPPYGFREQAQDALTATDWSETEFDKHEIATVLSDPQTRGYILSNWPGKPTGPVNFLPDKDSWKDVLLQEMLLMAIRWQGEPDLEVSVWSWDKFRELCLGDFDTFAAVASVYDLIPTDPSNEATSIRGTFELARSTLLRSAQSTSMPNDPFTSNTGFRPLIGRGCRALPPSDTLCLPYRRMVIVKLDQDPVPKIAVWSTQ
ncbi:hypothetical protein B0H14DRAFT_3136040 [Mycena olivaceomarginata]|nr:hypothetical protein B0H14DRAFT_3136040 [Mycena olivaceomarginata]